MERSQFLPSSRMRLGELVVWDCVLAFFVVGLLVADSVLAPATAAGKPAEAQPQSAQPSSETPPKTGRTNDAQPKDAADSAASGRRRSTRRRRGRVVRESAPDAGRLQALTKEALDCDTGAAALAVLARAEDLAGDPDYPPFRAQVLEHVTRLDALPALLPYAQHLADLRDADALRALAATLPVEARAGLDAELALARRAAPEAARVKTFRPGWRERAGTHAKLSSDLDDGLARDLLAALDAVGELAGRIGGPKSPPATFTLEVDAGAPLPQPGTIRRTDETPEALLDRARWAFAAHLVQGWKVPAPLSAGVTAFLAGSQDPRGTPTPRAQRWERLLYARGLSGDGEAVLEVQAGSRDWVLTWGWVRFAALDDSARESRAALTESLTHATPLSTWDAGRAAEAEQRWVTFLGSP
ncbi:MAG: hypothetical protein KDD82_07070 [Planctomycetes bacterium]|nr:hypothetical protein [Planctomycetota bacterium]